MNHSSWLEDRRWKWRVIVLIIVLIVVGALIWYGYDPLAAIGAALAIFFFAALIIGWIINDCNDPPPTLGQAADLIQQLAPGSGQTLGVLPDPNQSASTANPVPDATAPSGKGTA